MKNMNAVEKDFGIPKLKLMNILLLKSDFISI